MSGESWSLGERILADDPASPVAGPDVAHLQAMLGTLGYHLSVDGIYGPSTAEQVRQFQRHRGLRVDGVFGTATFRELSRVHDLATTGPGEPHYLRHRPS